MHLSDVPHILKRTWTLIAAVLVAVTGLVWLVTDLTKTYVSVVTVAFIGTNVNDGESAQYASQFIDAEMPVYRAMAMSVDLLEATIKESKVDITVEKLNVTLVTSTSGQTLIISASRHNASEAAALVNAMADVLTEAVNETHGDANTSVVKALRMNQVPKTTPVSSLPRTLVSGAVLGLVLGVAAALIKDRLKRPVGSAPELANASGKLVFPRTKDYLEQARRIRSVLQQRRTTESSLLLMTDVGSGENSLKLAESLAKVLSADGEQTTLVSLCGAPNLDGVDGVEVTQVTDFDGMVSNQMITDLKATVTSGRTVVVAAPDYHKYSDVLRIGAEANAMVLATTKSDGLRQVLETNTAFDAVGANLVGLALVG